MPKALTHDQFLHSLANKQPDIFNKFTILGRYTKLTERLLIRCNDCGAETMSPPNKLFAGRDCLNCRKLNNEKYFKRLFTKKPEYKVNFDYTGTNITSSQSLVVFKCRICDYVCTTQTATTHYEGNGCPSCNNRPSFSKELLIKKSKAKFGGTFDFSSTQEFSKVTEEISIGCPRHGLITTTAQAHLRTQTGCPKCHRYDAEEVFQKFYSNQNNLHIKFVDIHKDLEGEVNPRFIQMYCPSHGAYSTRLSGVLRGNGCIACYHDRAEGTYNTTLAERHKTEYLHRNLDVYVLYITTLKMYKLGLSKDLKHRVSCISNNTKSNVDILYQGNINLYDAIHLEKELLKSLSEYKGFSEIKFGGHTELLELSEDMATQLIEYLSTVTEEYDD